jgi:hypothetical protein
MIQTPRIDYRARGDATTESQASALANVYRFLIHSSSKRGRHLDKSGPDAAKEIKNDSRPRHNSR